MLVLKAVVDVDGCTLAEVGKPEVRFEVRMGIPVRNPDLDCSFPQKNDIFVCLLVLDDQFTLLKYLQLHEVGNLCQHLWTQTAQVWDVVQELPSLYHVLVIVVVHVVEYILKN